ncbi:MAG: hypothetical protein ACPG4X_19660 [Pikeienuella sp.]
MEFSIHNTESWPFERISPYKDAILGAFEMLQERFPDDVTVASLIDDAITGRKALWLVLDSDEAFVSLAMTQIRTVEATGKKIATAMDLAGRDHREFIDDLIKVLEQWAKDNDADLFALEGRPGWSKSVKGHGYKPFAVMWRKEVA